jgi:pimeloyl-ACP methyl ester carboxylesterase
MSQLIRRDVAVSGGQLPVWTRDGGSPALVFLHYWGGSHNTYQLVIEELAAGSAVVSYDHRGWGVARTLPGPYGISQLADDALEVVRELGIKRYVLVGHSMGGKTAQLAASRHPDGLAGLILIAPAPPRPAGELTPEVVEHAYDDVETITQSLDQNLIYGSLPSDLRAQVIHDSLAVSDGARKGWPYHGLMEDISEAAGAIEVPVLVLAGQHDRVDPPETLEANLLPVIRTAHMTVIEGTGHLSPLEVPKQIANHIDEFVATLNSRTP